MVIQVKAVTVGFPGLGFGSGVLTMKRLVPIYSGDGTGDGTGNQTESPMRSQGRGLKQCLALV